MKRTVELRPVAIDPDIYEVVKLVNSTRPRVGSEIKLADVQELIRHPGWTVVIKNAGSKR